jgi:hypothetical protein
MVYLFGESGTNENTNQPGADYPIKHEYPAVHPFDYTRTRVQAITRLTRLTNRIFIL